MWIATIDVLLIHCLEWMSHVLVHANLKVPNVKVEHLSFALKPLPKNS